TAPCGLHVRLPTPLPVTDLVRFAGDEESPSPDAGDGLANPWYHPASPAPRDARLGGCGCTLTWITEVNPAGPTAGDCPVQTAARRSSSARARVPPLTVAAR